MINKEKVGVTRSNQQTHILEQMVAPTSIHHTQIYSSRTCPHKSEPAMASSLQQVLVVEQLCSLYMWPIQQYNSFFQVCTDLHLFVKTCLWVD